MTNDETGFGLPIRVDVATGEKLTPSGRDPYALPWVQGAAATVPLRIRRKYASQVSDLREKLDVLRTKRGKRDPMEPVYGPRLRTRVFRSLDQRPFPVDGVVWGGEPAEKGWS